MSETTEVGSPVAEESQPLAELVQQQGEQEPEVKQEAEGEQEEVEKKESRSYTQDEVDKIVRKAKKNASYIARKEAEAELYRRMSEQPRQEQAKPAQQEQAPQRDQYESYEEYLEARAEWRADQKVKAALAEQQQREAARTQHQSEAQKVKAFEANLNKARESIADFDDVIDSAGDVPVTQTMRDAILESDVGALLTYHLAKNPAEAQRIAQLSPVAQIKALGAIEATLQAKPTPQVSKAPSPIKPLGGGSGGARDPSKMTMDEYIAWRNKRAG